MGMVVKICWLEFLGGLFRHSVLPRIIVLLFSQQEESWFIYSFVRSRFLGNIDMGSDSYPVLFDVDDDGDNDLTWWVTASTRRIQIQGLPPFLRKYRGWRVVL